MRKWLKTFRTRDEELRDVNFVERPQSSSLQHNGPPKESERRGLRVLLEPRDSVVDVIFIHGLTGSSHKTWFHSDSGVYWPVDLLGQDMPTARILSFGYDADIYRLLGRASGRASVNSLSDHAEALLGDLYELRVNDHSVSACDNL